MIEKLDNVLPDTSFGAVVDKLNEVIEEVNALRTWRQEITDKLSQDAYWERWSKVIRDQNAKKDQPQACDNHETASSSEFVGSYYCQACRRWVEDKSVHNFAGPGTPMPAGRAIEEYKQSLREKIEAMLAVHSDEVVLEKILALLDDDSKETGHQHEWKRDNNVVSATFQRIPGAIETSPLTHSYYHCPHPCGAMLVLKHPDDDTKETHDT